MSFLGSIGQIVGTQQAEGTASQNLSNIQGNVSPFINTGQGANALMWNELQGGQMGQAYQPTMQQLQQTPGYQFQLQQGLESTQNAAAARGLGVSGAALKGAANYASGLAASNYQQQFNDYWANQLNRYNMLAGLSNTGAQVATGSAQALTNAANLQAQAQINVGDAWNQGFMNLLQTPKGGANAQSIPAGFNNLMTQIFGS